MYIFQRNIQHLKKIFPLFIFSFYFIVLHTYILTYLAHGFHIIIAKTKVPKIHVLQHCKTVPENAFFKFIKGVNIPLNLLNQL